MHFLQDVVYFVFLSMCISRSVIILIEMRLQRFCTGDVIKFGNKLEMEGFATFFSLPIVTTGWDVCCKVTRDLQQLLLCGEK